MRYENDAVGLKAIGLSGARAANLTNCGEDDLVWGALSRRGHVQVIENDEKATNDIVFFSILAL